MRVLVTGGAGFIGSHIVDALTKAGAEVVVVDNLSTGFERNLNPLARFYKLDIGSGELSDVFERERPEVVVHEAAHTVVTRSIVDPAYDARINIMGSLNLLAACVASGVKRVVYASSCALYGKPESLPINESHPVNPLAHYGISKHTVEHYLLVYHTLNGLDYIALRYANVYGPRQNPRGEGGVVAIFAGKMLSGECPTIYGSGNKTRDYVYVGDVVRANMLAIESEHCGIYNIGTGVETTDQAVFDIIRRECNYKDPPRYAPGRSGEIKQIYLDCTRAARTLQWQPQVSLDEGIHMTVASYQAELARP